MGNRSSRAFVLLAAITLLSNPALAQGNTTVDPSSAPATTAQPGRADTERGGMAQVERRIADLQRRLKITPEQQPQWDAFTAVMRQNATQMAAMERARADKVATMNASEDMRSYAEVARAHADNMQRLVPAFDAVYAAMTPEQKATADRAFHASQGRMGRGRPRQP